MPITQKDIARRLNISRSVVASVLVSSPGARVADETRQRILAAASEMGYRPNAVASNLRRGKTGVVMLVGSSSGLGGLVNMGGAMETLAFRLLEIGSELKVRPFGSTDALLAGLREIATSSVCDQIVLWLDEESGEEAGELLDSLDFPFVIKGRHELRHPDWFQADFDHEAMMTTAVGRLVESGHRQIGYIGFDNDQVYTERLRSGFAAALSAQTGDKQPHRWMGRLGEGHDVADELLTEWLCRPLERRPTAVVMGAGSSAWNGVELALARIGRRLGLERGKFAAIGERPSNQPLLFGDAVAYDQAHLNNLSEAIVSMVQFRQTDEEAGSERIVRIVPQLHRILSLRLPIGSFDTYVIPPVPLEG